MRHALSLARVAGSAQIDEHAECLSLPALPPSFFFFSFVVTSSIFHDSTFFTTCRVGSRDENRGIILLVV